MTIGQLPQPRDRRFVGILIAAGRSRRMGTDKRLLAWPPGIPSAPSAVPSAATTVIAAAFDAIACWCATMVVVAEENTAVRGALGTRAYERVDGNPEAEMADSLRAGIVACADSPPASPPPLPVALPQRLGGETPLAIIIHLADHPAVCAATVESLLIALLQDPERAATPTYEGTRTELRGRGGHPVVIPWSWRQRVIDATAQRSGEGLRSLWIDDPSSRRRVPVDDPGILVDLDVGSDCVWATDLLTNQ